MAGALCAATCAWGQAVPSQAASTQWNGNGNGNEGGNGNSNSLQVQYKNNNYNQSQNAFIQFDLGVFPSNLPASAIQKATLVLYANNGGNPGSISVCRVSQPWSASTLTAFNAPSCANSSSVTFSVTAAELQQGNFVSVDITQIAQSWYAGSNNYGIALIPLPASGNKAVNVQFSSMQANGNSNGYPPMLDLVLASGSGGAVSQGAQGNNGSQDSQGQQGATGPTGPTGPTGAAGAAGINGVTGATGPAGIAGSPGATGPAGLTGVAGAVGASGPSGAQGLQGVPGALGPTGIQGPTGQQGANGLQGLQGVPGPSGAAGTNGTSGVNGTPGPTGATGPAGPAGTAGSGGGTLLSVTTTLTDAQIQALGTTPIQIVPAQGPGKIILPMSMAIYIPGTTSYSADLVFYMAGQNLLDWASALSPTAPPRIPPDFVAAFPNGNFMSAQGTIFGQNSAWTNQPLTVQAVGLGGAGNGVVITVWYIVWTTA